MTDALRRRTLLRAALALPLAGCLPTPYGSYYRPSAVGAPARLKRGWCQGGAGPESVIELDAPLAMSAQVEVVAGRPPGPLRLSWVVPAGRSLAFASEELRLTGTDGRTSTQRPTLSVWRTLTVAPGQVAEADRLAPLALPQAGASLALRADAPGGFAPPALRLRGPQLRVDDRPLAPLAVELARPEGDGLLRYHSAERRRALETRAADCRRETPQLACENLLRYDDLSFERPDAGATWRGALSAFRRDSGFQPLRVELKLEAPAARRWLLVDASARLEDPATDRQERLSFSSMAVSFAQSAPLSTPIRPTPPDLPGDTRCRLELPLPEGLDSFELRLPAARLDDRPVDLPALRFERRRFDGGFEPFNC